MSNNMGVQPTNSYLPETPNGYANADSMTDVNNVRLRFIKSNSPVPGSPQPPAHFVLSAEDFLLNEKENEVNLVTRNKHKKTRIILLILTCISYLLYTLRAYIPEHIQASSHIWSSIKPVPITQVYTSYIRPSVIVENLLLRSAEIAQTLWLIYIVSFIPRRTHLGYLYQKPNIFNSLLCSFLISAIALQAISQTPLPSEVSCACLFVSSILLMITCRLIAVKLVKYEEKFNTFDLMMIRYFVLNCLFLYTTSIVYLTICSSLETFAVHFNPTKSIITTIGLSIILILLLAYFLLDQLVYENEFRSIWSPYLYLSIAFHCPLFGHEITSISDHWNVYILWSIFITILFFLLIRLGRQIFIKYRQRQLKLLRIRLNENKSLETENQ